MSVEMKLPELGENIEGGDVLRVMVKPGDAVKKDQPVLERETDKATIEVPSSADGVIKEARVKAGEKIKVGQTIFVVDEGAAAAKAAPAAPAAAPEPVAAAPKPGPTPVPSKPVPAPEPPRPPAPAAAEPKRRAEVVEMTRPKPAPADAASIPAAPA